MLCASALRCRPSPASRRGRALRRDADPPTAAPDRAARRLCRAGDGGMPAAAADEAAQQHRDGHGGFGGVGMQMRQPRLAARGVGELLGGHEGQEA